MKATVAALKAVPAALLLLTSEFGTVSMWDWEIRDYLRRRGVDTVAPTSSNELTDRERNYWSMVAPDD